MQFDQEKIFCDVLQAADIEVFWENPVTGDGGFISRQPYSSSVDERPLTGEARLQRIPESFRQQVSDGLARVGEPVQFPYKQDGWFDYQWFEQQLLEEAEDQNGQLVRIYFSRRIQQTKQMELMLSEALDANRENIVEENLDTGAAKYLFKSSKNPDLAPQLSGSLRKSYLGEFADQISSELAEVGSSVQFQAMLPGRNELDWIRQKNIRTFITEQGEHLRWLMVKNITDSKKAELDLQMAYETLRRSTSMGGVGTFIYDFSTDQFNLDSTARRLMSLPEAQFKEVDSDALLSYVVGITPQQLREMISYQEETRGTQTLELNVRGWDAVHRWVRLKFEFLDAAEGLLACGVIIDTSESTRDQLQITAQLRKLEEQERIVDIAIHLANMLVVEIDLETGMGEILRGFSPHEQLYRGFDVDHVQRKIYSPEDYQRIKQIRDRPGTLELVQTFDVLGREPLYWAVVGYSELYRREGRYYQMMYRRIKEDIDLLSEQVARMTSVS